MKIAIDVSPLESGHKVRGVGFYLEHLNSSLLKYYPKNQYVFFKTGEKIPADIDLVHFPYFEPFFLALPIYKKYKTVVTVHDLTPIVFPDAFPKGLKGKLKWQMQKFSLKKTNAIITDSNSSKKDIKELIGIKENKINVVYLAAGEGFVEIKDEQKLKKVKEKYNLPDKFILYVGDVTWNKNLPRLLDAVKETNEYIVMVGKNLALENYNKSNPWNHDLNRVWELARENNKIMRLGFVPDEDLVAIYNLAQVFIMPSLYEGFGLPILEAMACGCPVITSKEGSIPEVAKTAAYYIDAYNVEEIVKGVTNVLNNDSLRNELKEKGLKNVQNFSWKKTAEETLRVYKDVLGIS